MNISPLAGKPAPQSILVNLPRLVTAYYSLIPDPAVSTQRVAFGTSGHRGSSLNAAFNEWHILAITQAICDYRKQQKTDGPLFIGFDTHALSSPAFASAMEVLAANGVETMIAQNDEYTPTPAISLAILTYNKGRTTGLADGIILTPSHNPPPDGGLKYNPPTGGAAEPVVTNWIAGKANELLGNGLTGVKRIGYEKALKAPTTHRYDYLTDYVNQLEAMIDFEAIRGGKIRMGIDPLGGAGVHYWPVIAKKYNLDCTIVSDTVDETFRFMTVDWDGQIRMDPSSPYAMERLTAMQHQFDIAGACDTDHDRHGIVTPTAGLMPPNHYLSVAIFYLFQHRTGWSKTAGIGKTVVSSMIIDRVAKKLGRKLIETPVGFKWFESGLRDGTLGFGGEESAGASFVRKDGAVWTTDKDGFVPALLAAEITAIMKKDPGVIYKELTAELGDPVYTRVDVPATVEQKALLGKLSPDMVTQTDMAGEKITARMTNAPGNNAPIGGLKVSSENGWFAARPSGTENIYKIYAESFKGQDHLNQILDDAQKLVNEVLSKGA